MSLAPFIPLNFGPHRRAALEESQAGYCAMCDERPIPNWKRLSHRFTCRRLECKAAWRRLCELDWHEAHRTEASP
jgi:hypothetical protein